jgi:SulP family sulfate permease
MLEVKLESQEQFMAFLLAVLLGLGSLAAYIPLSVLAGLLIPIGFKIIDVKGLKHLLQSTTSRCSSFNFSANNHYFRSLIQAVGLGVALASILFMKRQVTWAKKIIIESVENLKDENRGKMNYLSMR